MGTAVLSLIRAHTARGLWKMKTNNSSACNTEYRDYAEVAMCDTKAQSIEYEPHTAVQAVSVIFVLAPASPQ